MEACIRTWKHSQMYVILKKLKGRFHCACFAWSYVNYRLQRAFHITRNVRACPCLRWLIVRCYSNRQIHLVLLDNEERMQGFPCAALQDGRTSAAAGTIYSWWTLTVLLSHHFEESAELTTHGGPILLLQTMSLIYKKSLSRGRTAGRATGRDAACFNIRHGQDSPSHTYSAFKPFYYVAALCQISLNPFFRYLVAAPLVVITTSSLHGCDALSSAHLDLGTCFHSPAVAGWVGTVEDCWGLLKRHFQVFLEMLDWAHVMSPAGTVKEISLSPKLCSH